ncbi:hypothetical protein Bca52824_002471 [Brassica carinata]|uniref:glutathione transferase n=1 Tax=Brassica carinata TaxID=52824 RepID=A0A8X7WJ97_BRACI|nr:hypothetical protein Bca52824_002471 [Brassica carinata]
MAAIKVFGHPASAPTMRVVLTLHEKNLDFEFVHVDLMGGEHKKEAFLARNPFGQVPAFEDGDLKLFESRAITQYIAHRYEGQGTNLLPADSKNIAHYAIMAIGMQVEAHQFEPVAAKLVSEHVFKPKKGLTTDQAVVAEEEAKLAKVLDVYEARLKEFKYLAGDTFTLTDLHHIPAIQYLLGTPSKRLFTERPRVNEWVAEITKRPASQKILQ